MNSVGPTRLHSKPSAAEAAVVTACGRSNALWLLEGRLQLREVLQAPLMRYDAAALAPAAGGMSMVLRWRLPSVHCR